MRSFNVLPVNVYAEIRNGGYDVEGTRIGPRTRVNSFSEVLYAHSCLRGCDAPMHFRIGAQHARRAARQQSACHHARRQYNGPHSNGQYHAFRNVFFPFESHGRRRHSGGTRRPHPHAVRSSHTCPLGRGRPHRVARLSTIARQH